MSGRPRGARRLGAAGTSIFTETTRRAAAAGAIDLGQGFPDEDGPSGVREAARRAIAAGRNQYAPARGVPALRRAVAAHQRERYGMDVDPERGVQVCFGATEALAAALLALCEPGDEVVHLEPGYDAYGAAIALAGGVPRPVALRPPDFRLDPEALAAAITPRTRILLLNTPHNPLGRVLGAAELEGVAALCRARDLLAISDEVYEHLVFAGRHVPLATLPGMAERTLTLSSLGKTFSLTGWKVGWAVGPPALVDLVAAAKQYLSFSGGTPLQHAAAHALEHEGAAVAELREALRAKRDLLCAGLRRAGFAVRPPEGTYFAVADPGPLGVADGAALCRALVERAGVAAIPVGAFSGAPEHRPLVRWAFCKRREVLEAAMDRLAANLPAAVDSLGAAAR